MTFIAFGLDLKNCVLLKLETELQLLLVLAAADSKNVEST